MNITLGYLRKHPECVFVFGDNLQRCGCAGAASLRYEPNSYGFITKKYPSFSNDAYYTPEEYLPVFEEEMKKLIRIIEGNMEKTFLITKLGGGLANRFMIWEEVVRPGVEVLRRKKN